MNKFTKKKVWQEGRDFHGFRNYADIFRSLFSFELGVHKDKSCHPCFTLIIIRMWFVPIK